MNSTKKPAAIAFLIALFVVTASAQAQQTSQSQWNDQDNSYYGSMMGGRSMGPGMMGWAGPGGYWNGQGAYMCTMMTSHIEGRLAFLKTELKITDAQASLWEAYASAARQNAQTMTAHCTSMMSQPGPSGTNLSDRLDQHEQFMAAQLDAIKAMNKALKPLYAALSDAQKQVANQILWSPMGMM